MNVSPAQTCLPVGKQFIKNQNHGLLLFRNQGLSVVANIYPTKWGSGFFRLYEKMKDHGPLVLAKLRAKFVVKPYDKDEILPDVRPIGDKKRFLVVS